MDRILAVAEDLQHLERIYVQGASGDLGAHGNIQLFSYYELLNSLEEWLGEEAAL